MTSGKRMPTVKAGDLIGLLKSLGFNQARQKGSHRFFKHTDGRTATVPDHGGENLGRGLVSKILNDVEISKEDFHRWRQKKKL